MKHRHRTKHLMQDVPLAEQRPVSVALVDRRGPGVVVEQHARSGRSSRSGSLARCTPSRTPLPSCCFHSLTDSPTLNHGGPLRAVLRLSALQVGRLPPPPSTTSSAPVASAPHSSGDGRCAAPGRCVLQAAVASRGGCARLLGESGHRFPIRDSGALNGAAQPTLCSREGPCVAR
eukprot:159829-Prymnesium_polylepis.2